MPQEENSVSETMPDWYSGLDDQQKKAAEHSGSHAVLFAGPGTGKTRTLKGKALALVKKHGIDPQNILALSFTRVAAQQLRKDLQEALKEETSEFPFVATMHGFALRQLIKNSDNVESIPTPVRVADDYFERQVVIEDLKNLVEADVATVKAELNHLSSAWEQNLSGAEYDTHLKRNPAFISHWIRHREVFGYTLRAEMVYQVKVALEQSPQFQLESDFQHLIVDEFQDLNPCDLAVVKQLAYHGCEVTGAGDDDQSIYGFRHATPQAIRDFLNDYDGAKEFNLQWCFRCSKAVLDLAHHVIRLDTDRKDKGTLPDPSCKDGSVQLHLYADQFAEAAGISSMIKTMYTSEGIFPEIVLILLRSDHNEKYSKPIREALAKVGLVVADDTKQKPLETETGILLRAILSLCLGQADSVSWRIVLQLQRTNRIGETVLRSIYDLCVAQKWKFFEGLSEIEKNPGLIDKFGPRIATNVTSIREKLSEIYDHTLESEDKAAAMDETIKRAVDYVTGDTAVKESLLKELNEEIERSKCSSLSGLLSAIAAQSIGEGGVGLEPGIHILTMHKAKGLSADVVFIPVAEDHQIPGLEVGRQEELEALRLFFVSITRAKDSVIFSYAAHRTKQQGDYATGRPRIPTLTRFLRHTGLAMTDHRPRA